jgi:hypothetical protein
LAQIYSSMQERFVAGLQPHTPTPGFRGALSRV